MTGSGTYAELLESSPQFAAYAATYQTRAGAGVVEEELGGPEVKALDGGGGQEEKREEPNRGGGGDKRSVSEPTTDEETVAGEAPVVAVAGGVESGEGEETKETDLLEEEGGEAADGVVKKEATAVGAVSLGVMGHWIREMGVCQL